ncbi:hypothetical protein MBLNU230_g1118t1 [Neophaeotheca triangularis]
MSETRNIVVLGASFAGIAGAHHILQHTLPKLQQKKDAKYEFHIIDPSTHFWWRLAAPREMVSTKEMPHDKTFIPIKDGFKQYTNLKDSIHIHHAEVTSLDPETRTLTLKSGDKDDQGTASNTLSYYALVIATGTRSPTPLTTLQGDHTITINALDDMNTALPKAKDIVIGGGGPVAVETAGELGSHLSNTNITLITGGKKLLPVLRPSLSTKAEGQLAKLNVKTVYNQHITSSAPSSADPSKTTLTFSDGTTRTCDLYIPCVGVKPNTSFLPPQALNPQTSYLASNAQTLRLPGLGARCYALGDVGGYDAGGILNLYNAVPVFGANFQYDLFKEAGVSGAVGERQYHFKPGETQLVPVGAKTGVGAFSGWQMPGFAISMAKGKDYFLGTREGLFLGKKFAKP